MFRIFVNDRFAGPYLIEHLMRRYKKPAILLENTVWGRGNLEAMSRSLEQHDLAFVRRESFNRGESEFGPYLTRIEQSGADVIVLIAKPHDGHLVLRALAERAAPLPLVSHWGITAGDFWSANREALEKVQLTFFQTFSFLDDNPAARRLAERYAGHYGTASPREILAPVGVAQSHDAVYLLARAIEQAGTTDRAAIRDALEQLAPYDGVVKRYAPAFTPERHDALGPESFRLATYGKDGAIVPVGNK